MNGTKKPFKKIARTRAKMQVDPPEPFEKCTQYDQGEVQFGIAADQEHKVVIMQWPKPIYWIGMTVGEAREIAEVLMQCASDIEDGKVVL